MSTTVTALSLPTSRELTSLGEAIAEHGIRSVHPRVLRVVRIARGFGISPVLCQVAVDESAPEPVRERAAAGLIRRLSVVADAASSPAATDLAAAG